MRTVMYYVPDDIELRRGVPVWGRWWCDVSSEVQVYNGDRVDLWIQGEKGVMTLEQADLDTLVKHGLVVLGEVCEP